MGSHAVAVQGFQLTRGVPNAEGFTTKHPRRLVINVLRIDIGRDPQPGRLSPTRSGLGSTMDSRPGGDTVTGVTVESGAREAECGCGRRVGVPVRGAFPMRWHAPVQPAASGAARTGSGNYLSRGSDVAPGLPRWPPQSFGFLIGLLDGHAGRMSSRYTQNRSLYRHIDSVRRLASVSATGTVLFICGSFTWGYCESAFGINWLWLSLPSWLSIWSVLNPFMPPCGTWRRNRAAVVALRFASVILVRQLFNGFQLKTVLKDNGHFVTRPNRNDGGYCSAFDVVVAEGLGGFGLRQSPSSSSPAPSDAVAPRPTEGWDAVCTP